MKKQIVLSYMTDEGRVEYEVEILEESLPDLIKILDYMSDMEEAEEIVFVNETFQ